MTRQYVLPLPHTEIREADDYSVTDSNREAVAWINAWPEWPAPCLIIYGPAGSGKTHLAEIWQKRTGARVLDAHSLTEIRPLAGPVGSANAVRDAQTCSPFSFASFFTEEAPPVFIDNIESIAGNPEREEALFHLYNVLKETKGTLLLTAENPPTQWAIHLPDLRSRLCAAPAVGIQSPDDALLLSLLLKQFRDRQIVLGQDVAAYILPRIERTPAALRAIVAALDAAALAEKKPVTINLVKKVLEKQAALV